MGRVFEIKLSCGCLISLDGSGALIPCSYVDDSNCKFEEEYLNHPDYPKWEKEIMSRNNGVEVVEDD